MGPMRHTVGTDIIDALTQDHRAAEQLLDRFEAIGPERRGAWFDQLRETLVRHEVAEELVVYPALKGRSAAVDKVVEARIDEQAEAEKLLAKLEKMDPREEGFAPPFVKLRRSVLDHAQREEQEIIPFIEEGKTPEERMEMGKRYEKAKRSAPTHPHPHAPDTPPGNVVLGPVAALADRIRDAMRNDDDQG